MDVSVGVIAHNEEKNIASLLESLLSQELQNVRIREILVVSSGSTDRTNEIVRDFSVRDSRIRLLEEPERKGKYSAINLFLQKAGTDVVALVSGDVVPDKRSVERLCRPLTKGAGIATAKTKSRKRKGLLSDIFALQWEIHHTISSRKPKMCEMIAFRRVIKSIPKTSVDEETIGVLVRDSGYTSAYAEDAVFFNNVPRSFKDFIRQRRRVYAGHLELARKAGYRPGTMSNMELFSSLRRVSGVRILPAMAGAALEGISRLLGFLDFLRGRDHSVWSIVRR